MKDIARKDMDLHLKRPEGLDVTLDPFTGPVFTFRAPPTLCYAWNTVREPLREGEGGEGGGGGGGGGGGSGGDDKKYSDEDVERIVKSRMSSFAKKYADYDEIRAKAEAAAGLKNELAELKAKLDDRGKDDKTKELNAAKRDLEALTAKLQEAETKGAAAAKIAADNVARLDSYMIRTEVSRGLLAAGVLPKHAEQATRLLVEDGKAQLVKNEDGEVVGFEMHVAKIPFSDPKEGATKWLSENPHFAKAETTGGGGTRSGGGASGNGAGNQSKSLDELSPSQALRMGIEQVTQQQK